MQTIVLAVLPVLLHLVLPFLGTVTAAATTWIVAKEALGFGWLAAHAKSEKQKTALAKLQALTASATSAEVAKLSADVAAGKSATEIGADAVSTLLSTFSPDVLAALAKDAVGIGVDEVTWFLTHLTTAHAAPLSAAQGKTLLVPVGSTAGMSPAEKRNLVANAGVPAL